MVQGSSMQAPSCQWVCDLTVSSPQTKSANLQPRLAARVIHACKRPTCHLRNMTTSSFSSSCLDEKGFSKTLSMDVSAVWTQPREPLQAVKVAWERWTDFWARPVAQTEKSSMVHLSESPRDHLHTLRLGSCCDKFRSSVPSLIFLADMLPVAIECA